VAFLIASRTYRRNRAAREGWIPDGIALAGGWTQSVSEMLITLATRLPGFSSISVDTIMLFSLSVRTTTSVLESREIQITALGKDFEASRINSRASGGAEYSPKLSMVKSSGVYIACFRGSFFTGTEEKVFPSHEELLVETCESL
jgi:hypothetical protein